MTARSPQIPQLLQLFTPSAASPFIKMRKAGKAISDTRQKMEEVHEAIHSLLEWRFLSPQTRQVAELLKAGLEQQAAAKSWDRDLVDGEVNRQAQMKELRRVVQSLLRSNALPPEYARLAELLNQHLEKQIAENNRPEASAANGSA
jgi:hypothetical protein